MIKEPKDCKNKQDVRTEIDRIDNALIELFAERHSYVIRMAELKSDPHEAFDEKRIEAVIAKVREKALAMGLDDDQAEMTWRNLIKWNVNFEKGIIAARNKT